jgi:hypothetical protein
MIEVFVVGVVIFIFNRFFEIETAWFDSGDSSTASSASATDATDATGEPKIYAKGGFVVPRGAYDQLFTDLERRQHMDALYARMADGIVKTSAKREKLRKLKAQLLIQKYPKIRRYEN